MVRQEYPILFFKNKEVSLFENNAILDSGSNFIAVPEYIFNWLKNNSYEIINKKDKDTGRPIWIISDVSFKIGPENEPINYENEQIYYSPNVNIRVTSIGIKPIFEDFEIKFRAKIKTVILERH